MTMVPIRTVKTSSAENTVRKLSEWRKPSPGGRPKTADDAFPETVLTTNWPDAATGSVVLLMRLLRARPA